MGLAICAICVTYSNKDKGPLVDPEREKEIPAQGGKPATDCVPYLSLGKEVF